MPSLQLTHGLKKAPVMRELQPGGVFITRFKNSCRNYRTDLWIGVIMGEAYASENLNRRPAGAKTADGTWNIGASKRVYPLYMPGRNSSRWSEISDIFEIGDHVPAIFAEGSDREGADVYRRLYSIAKKFKHSCQFWEDMADEELNTKGRRSRELLLVLPDGYESLMNSSEGSQDSENAQFSEESQDDPPVKLSAFTPSFLQSRQIIKANAADEVIHVSFPGTTQSFAINKASSPLKKATCSSKRSLKATIPRGSSSKTGISVKEEAGPSSTPGRSFIFQMTIKTALESIFLEKEYSNDILAVFSDAVSVQELERAKIRSFLVSNEFTPQLIQVINSANNPVSTTADHDKISLKDSPLGDILGIGRTFQLKDITNAEDLSCQIIELGSLYTLARRYGMVKLVLEIRQKLQVAWNSYAGVSQLEPLLEVAQVAFEEDNTPPYDYLQDWLISFMADTYDLITTNESGAFFWRVFGVDDVLKDTIFARRAENIRTMPERYQHLPALLRSRGV